MSFSSQKSGRGWFMLLSAILLVVAAVQSILYLTCYDSDIGLYQYGFSGGALQVAYLIVALVLCLPLLFLKKSSPTLFARERTLPSSSGIDLFALLTSASIAATLITQLVRLYADDPLSILLLDPSEANSNAHTMLLISLVLALPAMIYFIGLFARKTWAYALLPSIFWVSAYLLRVYFDVSLLLMSPTRLMTIAALTATALFLLAELRLARGIFSPMLYGVSATLTALFAGVSGFSGLFLTIVGRLPISTETAYLAFQLSIALFALFRLKALLTDPTPARSSASNAEESKEAL